MGILTKSCDIHIMQPIIDDDHRDVLWYGGRVCEVEYKGWTFILGAYGDVIATLFEKDHDVEIAYSKDKRNSGLFYENMAQYIKDDAELKKFVDKGRLVLENNNWWEVLVDGPNGLQYDTGWVTDSNDYEEALEEMIDEMDNFIKENETVFSDELQSYLDMHLEDDRTETGGIAFAGETVKMFISEAGYPINTLEELNKALKECGIKTIDKKE